ncbi:site-specific integrase [Loigolactobacillus coryniformis]|uniref:site-specific integrase n=1 Tax=Loigolactobacillus coryniformis TaxID=1610 RepID=UPI0023401ABD|nr:site-specific integrase [Loigolactobacillus coryniformis]MDC4184523.1 site-specific integrase [Loigolactobacillus coryniformis]
MSKIKYSKKYDNVFSYKTANGTRYGFRLRYYDWLDKRHEKQKRGFSSAKLAYKAMLEVQLDITNGDTQKVEMSTITVAEWAKRWLASRKPIVRESTYRAYERRIRNHIIPLIGNCRLSDLNLVTYQSQFINQLLGFKRQSIIDYHVTMMIIVNAAVENDLVPRNRLKKARIPDTGDMDRRIMTLEELHKFNQALDKAQLSNQVIFYTLEKTGMRIGELLALRWSDIDFDNKIISITKTRDQLGERKPKTKSGIRKVQVTSELLHIYQKYRLHEKKRFLRSGHPWKDSNYILIGSRYTPLQFNTTFVRLRTVLRAAKLDYLIGHFTCHSFRHMHASYLLADQVNPIEIADRLGHKDPSMTLRVYGHKVPGKNNLAQKFEEITGS